MTGIKAFFAMDMAALGQRASRGWSWWMDELQGLLPAPMRERFGGRVHLVAELTGERFNFREYRPGSAVPIPRTGRVEDLLPRMVFAMPASATLLHEVILPALPPADLRRLIALDMNRLTPFRNEDVVFDLETGRDASVGGGRRVTIGIVQREMLQDMLDRIRGLGGCEPRAVSLVDRQTGQPRFDWLKAMRAPESGTGTISPRIRWWAAVLVLMAANISLLTLRDISSIATLQDQVDAQQPSVALATSLQHRIEAETRSRRLLLDRRVARAPLPPLAAVTHALPDSAYVQRFEWNGAAIRLVGMAQPGLDVVALLDAQPELKNAHATTPGRQGQAGAFDVTVEPTLGRHR